MNTRTLQVTYGGLLHDVGKPVYRAGGAGGTHSRQGYLFLQQCLRRGDWQPVLDCVRWHHAAELRASSCPPDSPAWIVYLADNLSAAADRREIEGEGAGFRRDLPLAPAFTHLNGDHSGFAVPPCPQDGALHQPQKLQSIPAGAYRQAVSALKQHLTDLEPQQSWVNSLLSLLETQLSAFPSSTAMGESADVSLYDHSKTTAAMAACLSEYLAEQGTVDLRAALFDHEAAFRDEPAFLLYTADFSGIQSFLYTVHTTNALKSLRSRSFFLELLMEHFIDELLVGCGVSRANLIYSGGGHCYLLLPNIPSVKTTLSAWGSRFNGWLRHRFGTRLYLAAAWEPCSGNDLTNTPAAQCPYQALFRRVNAGLERAKFHRYSAAAVRELNDDAGAPDGRECKVCGVSGGQLKNNLCPMCSLFTTLSADIQYKPVYVVSRVQTKDGFELPARDGGTLCVTLTDEKTARGRLDGGEAIERVYTKNAAFTGLTYATNLYVGDYAYHNINEMDKLAQVSQGVPRIGVCRMDVDDLGSAFISGFEQTEETDPARRMHFVTLSRTAAFSRQMSLFFRCYINGILRSRNLAVVIVYAGGDDVFLVGAWSAIIEAAQCIRQEFRTFCCGSLTVSAGIGIFDSHYPIRLAAAETAVLEQAAKDYPDQKHAAKNAVALFAPERPKVPNPAGPHLPPLVPAEQGHVYDWDTLQTSVLGEKLACLQSFFRADNVERGNAMLYSLLELLRRSDENRIDLARYTYLLARMRPAKNAPNAKAYDQFASRMMRWSVEPKDRHELVTAIYIDVYQNRKDVTNDGV